jgi:type I restriction enzyme M protein
VEKPDFTVGKLKFKTELVAPSLVIGRDFAADQAAIDALDSEASSAAQSLDELAEEHGGEDGLLADAKDDKDKLTKASVSARLKEIKADPEAADERKLLGDYLALTEKRAALNAQAGAARESLAAKVAARYGTLTEDEIKALVVDDKWLAALEAAVQGELDRVSQRLAGRVRELAERYATPLPALEREVAEWSTRVGEHLARMGFRS